jgi:hypothetical protein
MKEIKEQTSANTSSASKYLAKEFSSSCRTGFPRVLQQSRASTCNSTEARRRPPVDHFRVEHKSVRQDDFFLRNSFSAGQKSVLIITIVYTDRHDCSDNGSATKTNDLTPLPLQLRIRSPIFQILGTFA